MRIGVIGSGKIGGTLARLFARAGEEVAIANSRGPETLTDLVAEIGAKARVVTVEEAAAFADGGRRQQPGSPICNVRLTPAEASRRLASA